MYVLAKEEVYLEFSLLKYFPVTMVDTLVTLMAKAMVFMYGDPSKYGLVRSKQGFSAPNSLVEEL